jgi:hypothetical protein
MAQVRATRVTTDNMRPLLDECDTSLAIPNKFYRECTWGFPDIKQARTPAGQRAGVPSPYISHYLCMIGQLCDETRLLFCRCGMPWHLETRGA